MEQNLEHRNKSKHIQSFNIWQGSQENAIEKKTVISTNSAGIIEYSMWKNEMRGTSSNVQWLRCYASNAGRPQKQEKKERTETGPVPHFTHTDGLKVG